ncbi:MAG: ATPase, T2SS/T4P/T4SS family [Acidobacteriota bacterium]
MAGIGAERAAPLPDATLLKFLVEQGLVRREDAERVRGEEETHGGGIFFNLLKLKLVTAPKLFNFVEEKLGLLYTLAEDKALDSTLLELIPANIAQFYKIVPLRLDDNTLTIAAAAVSSFQLIPALEEITGYKIRIMVAHPVTLSRALDRYYSPKADPGVFESGSGERVFVIKDEEKQVRPVNPQLLTDGSAPADWLRTILAEAVIKKSRHLYFRHAEQSVNVVFVREGEPEVEFRLAPALYQSIATFIDHLTSVGAFDVEAPYERRMRAKVNERIMNVQVCSAPIADGRTISIELYDQKSFEHLFEGLFNTRIGEDVFIRKVIEHRKGLLLTAASPTASRKLVLYSLMGDALKKPPSVFTLEESIYYALPGVHQISFAGAEPKVFSRQLETALRQRPDLLIIDAIHDAAAMELALLSSSRCAVVAALTSPDVYSTLRWLDLNGFRSALKARLIPAFLQVAALGRVCRHCRADYTLSEEEVARCALGEYRRFVFYHNAGCPACREGGLQQEELICELVPVDEHTLELAEKVGKDTTGRATPRTVYTHPPFPTLLQKGVSLAAAGKVDIKDVLDKCAFLV